MNNEVRKLQKQVRILTGCLIALAMGGIALGFAPERDNSSLTLTSPDGKNTIVLRADNNISGIWR